MSSLIKNYHNLLYSIRIIIVNIIIQNADLCCKRGSERRAFTGNAIKLPKIAVQHQTLYLKDIFNCMPKHH